MNGASSPTGTTTASEADLTSSPDQMKVRPYNHTSLISKLWTFIIIIIPNQIVMHVSIQS